MISKAEFVQYDAVVVPKVNKSIVDQFTLLTESLLTVTLEKLIELMTFLRNTPKSSKDGYFPRSLTFKVSSVTSYSTLPDA